MSKCHSVRVSHFHSVRVSQCVTVSQFHSVTVSQCHSVSAIKCFYTWCCQPGPVEGVGAGGGETEGEPDQGVLTGEVGPPQLGQESVVLRLLPVPAVPRLRPGRLQGGQEVLQLCQLQPLQNVDQPPPPPPVILTSLASQPADQL